MKKSLQIIFLLAITLACNTNKEELKPIDLELAVYNRAAKVNDATTALSAAYRIVLLDTSRTNYYDSIATILFELKNYNGAKEVAKNTIKDHRNVELYKILASSSFNLQEYSDAILYYQDLIREDSIHEVVYLYELGTTFYTMGNFQTAFEYMQKILDHDNSRMMKKEFYTDDKLESTYYYVAALNIMGVIYIENKDYNKAAELYQELLLIDPDFQLAKNNRELVRQLSRIE